MPRSVQPRTRAGVNSWIVELIAVYSPPIPAPVRKRNSMKLIRFHDSAVAAVAARYSVSVTKNSLRRPSRSVSQPKPSAPSTAPAMYALPARPTSAFEKRSAGLVFSALATAPASVTSRPSSSHVTPSATTISV